MIPVATEKCYTPAAAANEAGRWAED